MRKPRPSKIGKARPFDLHNGFLTKSQSQVSRALARWANFKLLKNRMQWSSRFFIKIRFTYKEKSATFTRFSALDRLMEKPKCLFCPVLGTVFDLSSLQFWLPRDLSQLDQKLRLKLSRKNDSGGPRRSIASPCRVSVYTGSLASFDHSFVQNYWRVRGHF